MNSAVATEFLKSEILNFSLQKSKEAATLLLRSRVANFNFLIMNVNVEMEMFRSLKSVQVFEILL